MTKDTEEPGCDASSASVGGGWHWTVAMPEADPEWSMLERAIRSTDAQWLFRWKEAHLLPDGTRVDEFVHLRSTALLFVSSDGRYRHFSGMGPGAIGPSLLLTPSPPDSLEHVPGLTRCDEFLHLARRALEGHGEPIDQPGDPRLADDDWAAEDG